jgi:hypothetical protein
VPTDNIRFLANCIEAADRANRAFFIVILSYIDTDRRLQEVLGYVNNSAGISTFVSFLLITRTERVGEKGKCSAVQDLLDQTGLCESQIFFVDDTCEVIIEFTIVLLKFLWHISSWVESPPLVGRFHKQST